MRRAVILLAVLLTGCNLDSEKRVNLEDFDFKTGDDTEIFFKNVRQYYYDLEENKEAKLNIFRYEDRVVNAEHPLLNLAIVINYLQDEASLILEPSNFNSDSAIRLQFKDNKNSVEKLSLTEFNRMEMLKFANGIYEALLSKKRVFLEIAPDKLEPILVDSKEREAFRITVSDYYRLTRLY
ncbi:hypothetical protein [Fulvivirga ligni]|uniref:hypothetical protein n=1 Tax=Fulvivirga ligni TaxID=2904246 RepID=UPI001F328828|nr:hypothetical protein [Fulvivirga ligni]UII22519.1 hypothetical protein LVD16_04660 [Fulvivirga ligni]